MIGKTCACRPVSNARNSQANILTGPRILSLVWSRCKRAKSSCRSTKCLNNHVLENFGSSKLLFFIQFARPCVRGSVRKPRKSGPTLPYFLLRMPLWKNAPPPSSLMVIETYRIKKKFQKEFFFLSGLTYNPRGGWDVFL